MAPALSLLTRCSFWKTGSTRETLRVRNIVRVQRIPDGVPCLSKLNQSETGKKSEALDWVNPAKFNVFKILHSLAPI